MNIVVIGMGYVGIPCAALFADVPGFQVTGIQRRSERSGWEIDCLNGGKSPFEGDEPGLEELINRMALEMKSFRVTEKLTILDCGRKTRRGPELRGRQAAEWTAMVSPTVIR